MYVSKHYAPNHKQWFNLYYNYTLQHYDIWAVEGLTPYEIQANVYASEQEALRAINTWDRVREVKE